jgi:hypothetical protein
MFTIAQDSLKITPVNASQKAQSEDMPQQSDGSKTAVASVSLMSAALFCLVLIVVFVVGDLLFFAQGASFKREGGGLENVSALLYGIAALVFFRVAPRSAWGRLFNIPVMLVLFALRELDFDKAFTENGILSLRMYSGDASIATKLVAGAVALFAIFVILRTAWQGVPAVLSALKARCLWPWFAIAAAGLVVATKSIDGLGRKLLEFGIVISEDLDATAALVEEVGEAFIPVCAILAILACWRGTRA